MTTNTRQIDIEVETEGNAVVKQRPHSSVLPYAICLDKNPNESSHGKVSIRQLGLEYERGN